MRQLIKQYGAKASRRLRLAPPVLLGLLLLVPPATAQDDVADWPARKCALYGTAWQQALAGAGPGVDTAFAQANKAFIASRCTTQVYICPRTPADLALANALTLALMNAGTASTFLPFRCPPVGRVEGGYQGPGL